MDTFEVEYLVSDRKLCLSEAKRSTTAASILSSFSLVLNDFLLALARTFVQSTAISSRLISPSAISAVTLFAWTYKYGVPLAQIPS